VLLAVIVSLAFTRTAPTRPACTQIPLEADTTRIVVNRFDGPEYIRGLHARGDTAGAPIHIAVRGEPDRIFYLWAVDTQLDGVERYDRLAASVGADVAVHFDQLVPLRPNVVERVLVSPNGAIDVVAPRLAEGLRNLTVCVG
jgi:hypothetical protein